MVLLAPKVTVAIWPKEVFHDIVAASVRVCCSILAFAKLTLVLKVAKLAEKLILEFK
jgi:hypothetical protein